MVEKLKTRGRNRKVSTRTAVVKEEMPATVKEETVTGKIKDIIIPKKKVADMYTVKKPIWEQHRRWDVGEYIKLSEARAKAVGLDFLIKGKVVIKKDLGSVAAKKRVQKLEQQRQA